MIRQSCWIGNWGEVMLRSLRWLITFVISVSVVPMGAAAHQVSTGNSYTCPTEIQAPPDGAAVSGQVRGVDAVAQGEPFTVDTGGSAERTYTVISTDYTPGFDLNTHRRGTQINTIIVCLQVAYADSANDLVLETGYLRLGTRDEEIPGFTDYTATARFNGASADEARAIGNAQTAWTIDFQDDRDQIIPLAFRVYPNQPTEMFLTEGDPAVIADQGDIEWAMLVDLADHSDIDLVSSADGPPERRPVVGSQPTTAPRATQASGITSGTVTEFNEPTVITLGLEKWRLNFDPAVEVRSSIAGVTPQRGQFLVIWFDQFSTQGEPLPLGNFTLQTSTGPGEPFGVRALSQEGTTGLILTEYTWSPDTMSASTDYRTGIAFDIAPEDTHFVLQYRGPAQTLGNDYVVDLEFDA